MIPVFADIDFDTFNLDTKAVEAAITSRTRAIIPVHFAGQPADMDAIMKLARKHKLFVLEDAAHAHGAAYKGRPAGSLGHAASFSFQSSKNLTCGEGGIITTNDATLAANCRSIHNCGRVPNGVWYDRLAERILDLMDANTGTRYELQPDRQMMFILNRNANEPLAALEEAFPGGDERHQQFGVQGIITTLRESADQPLEAVLEELFAASNRATKGAGRLDDTSIMLLERGG